MAPIRHITTSDNCTIALRCISPAGGADKSPVILTHGTFSNARICKGLARYLAARGHACWILEWRGHGSSRTQYPGANFEDTALKDVPAAIEYVRRQYPAGTGLTWIGHSGGGLVLPMYLARYPETQRYFKAMVTIASQASGACRSPLNKGRAGLALGLITLMGYSPGSAVGLGPEDESKAMMQQWIWWNLKRKFTGSDGFRYDREMINIRLPLLTIAADRDRFIAPPAGCREFFNMFGGHPRSLFRTFSEPGKGFTHSRIMMSRSAERTVWPFVADWLEAL